MLSLLDKNSRISLVLYDINQYDKLDDDAIILQALQFVLPLIASSDAISSLSWLGITLLNEALHYSEADERTSIIFFLQHR